MNKYLKEIGKIKIDLISTKKIGKKLINSIIFYDGIPEDLKKHKKKFFAKLDKSQIKIDKIKRLIEKDNNLNHKEKSLLNKEIRNREKRIEFLKKVYDTEAHKLDKKYIIKEKLNNYDHYNKIFFGVDKNDLNKKIIIKKNKHISKNIKKEKLIELLNFSKELIPELKWNFGEFPGLSHSNGVLNIPDQEKYNIKRVIAIFFHEMTHFFRYLNGFKNTGYHIEFHDYMTLEEGIAGYNEYYYGNKIIDYGKYNFYYDKCYQIILKDISEKEKKELIKKVLKNKGFTNKQINFYYKRFYRYTCIGSKELFLKDLIYGKAYNNVVNLLKENKENYKKIMAGKIGLYDLKINYIKPENNFDSRAYFKIMTKKIKELL